MDGSGYTCQTAGIPCIRELQHSPRDNTSSVVMEIIQHAHIYSSNEPGLSAYWRSIYNEFVMGHTTLAGNVADMSARHGDVG
jgi:hypothetical protein